MAEHRTTGGGQVLHVRDLEAIASGLAKVLDERMRKLERQVNDIEVVVRNMVQSSARRGDHG